MNPSSVRKFASSAVVAFALFAPSAAFAVTIDLTAGGTELINGATFTTTNNQSTGTGVIEPFLRLQKGPNETGLNSNEGQNDLLADTKSGIWTHDITLADLGTTVLGGADHYVFLLDINENDSAKGELISLDTFQLYTRGTSITDGVADTLAAVQAGGTLRYDMDTTTPNVIDRSVLLNYTLNEGSGSGDLFVYVPTALFAGVSAESFLYLYTQFGYLGVVEPYDYTSDAGFEEWATTKEMSTSVADGGSTVALLGLGLSLAALSARRRKVA